MSVAEIVACLEAANDARPSNFEVLTVAQWYRVAENLQKEHPKLKLVRLEEAIRYGTMGCFNYATNLNPPINSMTIFRWVRAYMDACRVRVVFESTYKPGEVQKFDFTLHGYDDYFLTVKRGESKTISKEMIFINPLDVKKSI